MIKSIFVISCAVFLISCQHKNTEMIKSITDVSWILETVTVSPQIMVDGKTTSDYKNSAGPNSSLANNCTLSFQADGTYHLSSNGPLCDMVPSTSEQTWLKDGSTITLNQKNSTITAKITGNQLSYTVDGGRGLNQPKYVYTYLAKLKKS